MMWLDRIPRVFPAVALLVCLAACGDRERVVGFRNDGGLSGTGGGAGLGAFGAPVPVSGLLGADDLVQDPSLSPDEREIYFAAVRNGTYDIWMSRRAATGQPWAAAVTVTELSTTDEDDYEPDLSADGLTMYLTSKRPGSQPDLHIWVARRAARSDPWGVPQPVPLGTSRSDRGPTVDVRGLTLVFSSDRGQGNLDLYLARRAAVTAPWGTPVTIDELNSTVADWDAGLFRGGRGLIFASRRGFSGEISHLFETARATDDTPFSPPQALVELRGPMSEGDPWLSDDGKHIVFSSDRTGVSRLYEAWR